MKIPFNFFSSCSSSSLRRYRCFSNCTTRSALRTCQKSPTYPMELTCQTPPTYISECGFRKMTNSKVCIVCLGRLARDCSKLEYMLYVVDVGTVDPCEIDSEIKRPPMVRISDDSFSYPAICILGSKLYIFEGCCWGPKEFDKCYNPDGKSIFTYDLSESDLNLELDKSMMVKEAVGMNDIKFWPIATATPNGKILVFSSKLETDLHGDTDFELYDPATRTCHKLPNLPGEECNCITCIKAFTFMKRNVFLVRTEMHGVFAIDLDRLPQNWTWKKSAFRWDGFIPSHIGNTFVVIEKKICLTPDMAYDIRVHKGRPRTRRFPSDDGEENMFATLRYYFPDQSSVPYRSYQAKGVTLLDPEDEDEERIRCRVCYITAVVNPETMHPELMLAVYCTDLDKCLEELAEHRSRKEKEDPVWWKRKTEDVVFPATSKVRSLKVIVPEQYDVLSLWYFSSLGF